MAHAGSFEFTDDADWDLGTYNSTNSGPPGADDQIQLNPGITTQFDHIWVAASGRGTAIRINTDFDDGDDGLIGNNNHAAVLGEYYTAPSGQPANPSRTTVDQNGDVWVGNRNAGFPQGSVTKISASASGPGTSTGVWNAGTGAAGTFDARAWTNAGGLDTGGGTATATDPAILHYVRTDSTNNRTIAIDANNDVWVGGLGNRQHLKLDGDTGAQIGTTSTVAAGGYGGLIDGNGILWSADWSNSRIARYDTNAADPGSSFLGFVATGGPSYGLGVDSQGNIWNSHYNNGTITKLDSSGAIIGTFALGTGSGSASRGVAVTPDDHIWVANSNRNTVTRLDNNGNVIQQISVGAFPTGVSVDSNGKVWVTNLSSSNVMRIDPATNAVDLTVDLGAGANPYNYSDMTGTVVSGTTNPTGTWLSLLDSGLAGTEWDKIFWNQEAEGTIPTGTGIVVEVRTADILANLAGAAWTSFSQVDDLNLFGRYAQVRATLTRTGPVGSPTPVLSDLRLTTIEPMAPIPLPAGIWLMGAGGLMLFGIGRRRNRKTS
ncbi:hypothetical protein [Antarctobacter jejuensis]|uniref:hypothetical protein n=1 Tax=Antarctobacter jejuensis TaxID=1439938 RepID=UPI003FD2294E